jgi:hypothetical protein
MDLAVHRAVKAVSAGAHAFGAAEAQRGPASFRERLAQRAERDGRSRELRVRAITWARCTRTISGPGRRLFVTLDGRSPA